MQLIGIIILFWRRWTKIKRLSLILPKLPWFNRAAGNKMW